MCAGLSQAYGFLGEGNLFSTPLHTNVHEAVRLFTPMYMRSHPELSSGGAPGLTKTIGRHKFKETLDMKFNYATQLDQTQPRWKSTSSAKRAGSYSG